MRALRPDLSRLGPVPLLLAAAALALVTAAACDGDPNTVPTPPPSASSPGPTSQPTRPAPPPGTAVGAAYVILGGPDLSGTIDLAETQPFLTVMGADGNGFVGDSLASTDVNGDGVADLIVGATFARHPVGPEMQSLQVGAVYVIFGSSGLGAAEAGELATPTPPPTSVDAELGTTIDLATEEATTVIFGADSGDYRNDLPALVTGDVNGDGLEDLLIGARFGDGPENSRLDSGEAYVIFGSSELPATIDLAAGDQDITIYGAAPNDQLGFAGILADVNGDGFDDIVLGAPFVRREGVDDQDSVLDMAQNEFDVAIFGAEEFDEVGDMVAAGDVNGDGIGDIIIGAEAADGPGNERSVAAEVYVVYGSTDLSGILEIERGDQDVTIFGSENNDTMGFNLAIGDVDGDGVDDILITARLADGPGNITGETGEIHIVLGSDSLPEIIDAAAEETDAYIYTQDGGDMLGASLGTVDLDGDGRQELMTASGFADGPSNERNGGGEAYVLDASDLQGAIDVLDAPLLLTIYGPQPGDAFGAAITAGDLDGDGAPELIVLALEGERPDGSRSDAGQLYIIKP